MANVSKYIVIVLLFLKFLEPNVSLSLLGWMDFPLLILMVYLCRAHYRLSTVYEKCVFLYVGLILLNCIYSSIDKEQPIFQLLFHSYRYIGIVFFLYLYKSKASIQDVEKVLIGVCVIICMSYIIQWLIFPTVIFRGAEDESWSDENYRVRIPGSIGCYCLFFYSVVKLILKKRTIYVMGILLGGMPIIIMGFRSLVFATLLSLALMIPFVLKNSIKTSFWLVIIVLGGFLAIQTGLVNNKVIEMKDRTDSGETFARKDYIRWIELDYYWNNQFSKTSDKILGGGIPIKGSKYASDISKAYSYGLYWDDLGVLGLGMILGYPAVIVLIFIYLICIWNCNRIKYQYLRFTLLAILLASFTTAELFRNGNLLILSIIMYMIYKSNHINPSICKKNKNQDYADNDTCDKTLWRRC